MIDKLDISQFVHPEKPFIIGKTLPDVYRAGLNAPAAEVERMRKLKIPAAIIRRWLDERQTDIASRRDTATARVAVLDRFLASHQAIIDLLTSAPPITLDIAQERVIRAHEAVEFLKLLGAETDSEHGTEMSRLSDWIQESPKFSFLGAEITPEGFKSLADFGRDLRAQDLFRLPYPKCWFEFSAGGLMMAIHACEIDGVLAGQALIRHAATRSWGVLGRLFEAHEWGDRRAWVEFFDAALFAMVTLLASKSAAVESVEAPAKLNEKRSASSRPPIDAYRIITVRAVAAGSGTGGGRTHRSPRMHWRRGHLRHMRSGVVVSIAPMLVGVAENGFLSKDYRVALTATGIDSGEAGETRSGSTPKGQEPGPKGSPTP